MAKTITVVTKVEQQVYERLVKLAAAQKKSVAELVRELIEKELAGSVQGASVGMPEAIVERLDALEQQMAFHHNALGELLIKAVRAGAGARYFARLATSYGQDIAGYMSNQKPLEAQTKKSQMAEFEKKAKEFEQHFLKSPPD